MIRQWRIRKHLEGMDIGFKDNHEKPQTRCELQNTVHNVTTVAARLGCTMDIGRFSRKAVHAGQSPVSQALKSPHVTCLRERGYSVCALRNGAKNLNKKASKQGKADYVKNNGYSWSVSHLAYETDQPWQRKNSLIVVET
jgi:hypothetical protein